MATHIQPSELADAGIAGETSAPPVRQRRRLGSGLIGTSPMPAHPPRAITTNRAFW